jgi:hypothetical protein
VICRKKMVGSSCGREEEEGEGEGGKRLGFFFFFGLVGVGGILARMWGLRVLWLCPVFSVRAGKTGRQDDGMLDDKVDV